MSPAQRAFSHSNRVRTAHALLDDTSMLLKLHRLVTTIDGDGLPAVHIISTHRPLLSTRRVGLFAGSFNPLTRAHLAVAEAARQVAALDAIVWVISSATVDKERVQRASVPDRLAQLDAFVRTSASDTVAIINRGLYVQEAEALRRCLTTDTALFVLIGFDKILQIFDPHYYDDRDSALRELFGLAHVLVAPRDNQGADALASLLARPENQAFSQFVQLIPVPPEHTRDSSTEVRALAAVHPVPLHDLRLLLPPEGLALAQTGAYAPSDGTFMGDRYALRERWLVALAAARVSAETPLPPLSRLVARAARPTKVGARLREWLASPATRRSPLEVRHILSV
ncbi:MAG TPA: hypothetical protein VKQ30_21080 [Ktedonobacterales bacterium]|nr:hypothetical protein [Ktedonobacterales bacterium]